MIPEVLAALRCPVCREPLAASAGALRCAAGHAFDVAREGYVNLLGGRKSGIVGDDARMVQARARFLAAGHLAPLAEALASRAAEAAEGAPGLLVEIGAGTAYYLARALDAAPARAGLAIDVSKHAARQAARAHPRAGAVVANAWAALPLADGCAGVVLDVFAPRNGAELRRILRDDGALLVVTPTAAHLAELRAPLGLLEVDPGKERRVGAALEPLFARASSMDLEWTMTLPHPGVLALAGMGPSARHADDAEREARVRALPDPIAVTASVRVAVWRPRPATSSRPGGGQASPAPTTTGGC
jgi:23S rRNA (guanine745-N1)-methyltransferase